ncbi:MAG: glycosyltransferase, partial [Candidatus Solibacter usitatus]|nr:glycosyltransferase [Candidatus Solibacter usitatus]
MRVLHAVLSGRMAGGQKVCLDLIRDQVVRGWDVLLSSPSEGPMVRACPDQVRVFFHPVERIGRPAVLGQLVRFLRSERPDLIHTHVTVSGNVLWRLAGRLAGVPVINHVHIGNYFRPGSLSGR